MPRLNTPLFMPALAILTLLGSLSAAAQDNRWFRVELLVFTNQGAPAATATGEQWDPLPELAYPDEARYLIYPERVRENLREYPGASVVDTFGRQIITLSGNRETGVIVPPRPVIDTGSSAAPPQAAPGTPADPNTPAVAAAPDDEASPAPPPIAFVVLPPSYQDLRPKAAQLQRSGRHQLLFHETWLQPVPSESTSLPIVLDRSGDTGQWPRLQGSIKLYLSRYLQVETNLWLNTDGSYLSGDWQMPAPPLSPPSLVIEEALPTAAEVTTAATAAGGSLPDTPAGTSSEAAGASAAPLAGATGVAGAEEGLAEVIPEEDTGPAYPFRHAVILQQKARMRSNETHYIDHPLLGVVVRFTPVSAEELAAIAAQQPPLPGTQAP